MPQPLDLHYEVVRSKTSVDDSEYRVEAIDPREGECYVAIFAGPFAKERAVEYAAFKNLLPPRH